MGGNSPEGSREPHLHCQAPRHRHTMALRIPLTPYCVRCSGDVGDLTRVPEAAAYGGCQGSLPSPPLRAGPCERSARVDPASALRLADATDYSKFASARSHVLRPIGTGRIHGETLIRILGIAIYAVCWRGSRGSREPPRKSTLSNTAAPICEIRVIRDSRAAQVQGCLPRRRGTRNVQRLHTRSP